MRIILALVLAVFGPAALASGLEPGPRVQVRAVIDGDTVVLAEPVDGADQVRLVGIQAPKLPLGRAGFKTWPLAAAAKAALEVLVLGKTVDLAFGGRRMDRHGRILAPQSSRSGSSRSPRGSSKSAPASRSALR